MQFCKDAFRMFYLEKRQMNKSSLSSRNWQFPRIANVDNSDFFKFHQPMDTDQVTLNIYKRLIC